MHRAKKKQSGLAVHTEFTPHTIPSAFLHLAWSSKWRIPIVIAIASFTGVYLAWNSLTDKQKESFSKTAKDTQSGQTDSTTHVAAFEILERDVTVDLRGWTSVPEKLDQKRVSPAIWRIKMRLRKTSKVKEYSRDIASSSITPDITAFGRDYRIAQVEPQQIVGRRNLNKVRLFVDVADEPLDSVFLIEYQIISWNNFNGKTGDWFGDLVADPTKVVRYKILFPDQKKTSKFMFYEYTQRSNKYELYPGKLDTVSQNNTLTWTKKDPRLNHCYEIGWTW